MPIPLAKQFSHLLVVGRPFLFGAVLLCSGSFCSGTLHLYKLSTDLKAVWGLVAKIYLRAEALPVKMFTSSAPEP